MVMSLCYWVLRRLLELIVLRRRGERANEIELLAPPRGPGVAPAGIPAAVPASRPGVAPGTVGQLARQNLT
jgi:hypothetical protein